MDWIPAGTLFVGIVGVALAAVAYFTRMINRIIDRLDTKIESIETTLKQNELRFDRLEERQTRVEGRMDMLEHRMLALEQRQTVFEARVDKAFQDARDDSAAMLEAVQALGVEQARMLGFLEGRGIMGLAQVEATPTP